MTLSAKSMMIETMAGIGQSGYGGDGGPAGDALLNEPKGLAVDAEGHLYIADSENHVVRKVDRLTGLITTIAGSASISVPGASAGQAGSAPSREAEEDPLGESSSRETPGFSQVADISGTVRFVTGEPINRARFAGDGGPALTAQLNFPTAVVVDAGGNVYIADTMNHRIRIVEAATGFIRTIAGTGHPRYSGDGGPAVSAGLQDPSAIVLDGRGHYLYIADQSNNRIRAVDLRTGLISTVAGNGTAAYNGDGMPAREACLSGPSGLAIDADGMLYIADTFNGRIRAVNLETGIIETVAGDGGEYRLQDGEESVSLSRPYGIAVDRQGNILLTDSDSHLLRMFEKRRRVITRLAGSGAAAFSGDGGSADSASFSYPFGIAIDGNGVIYVADTFNHRVRRLSA